MGNSTGKDNENAPLLQNSGKSLPPLYDSESLLHMDGEVARGFIVLLGGTVVERNQKLSAPKISPSDIDETAASLGFLALTEGNTIDAAFGVNNITTDQQGKKCAQQVKGLLADAVDSNESIERLAVITYQGAYRIVYAFCDKKRRMNIFTRCFCFRKVHMKAEQALEDNFQHLEEALQATR